MACRPNNDQYLSHLKKMPLVSMVGHLGSQLLTLKIVYKRNYVSFCHFAKYHPVLCKGNTHSL